MIVTGTCSEEQFCFILCIASNIQAMSVKRETIIHTHLDHDKSPLEALHGSLYGIDIQGYICQDVKSHIFKKLIIFAMTKQM